MTSFEYVMVLVSIVVALAIAHLLTALGECVRRIRGKGEPIKLDAVFLLWVGDVLIWLISFWWWEFKFQEVVTAWSFGLYLFVIGYAISLFMLAEILVPHRMKGVTDTYIDFVDGRKWFFGTLIFVQAIDIVDTYLKGIEWVMRPASVSIVAVTTAIAIIGFVSVRRPVQLAVAIIAFSSQLLYVFVELGILGSW
jgi:hypothetical protein